MKFIQSAIVIAALFSATEAIRVERSGGASFEEKAAEKAQ